jgi:uncharacterized membrane protein (DUF485 family)
MSGGLRHGQRGVTLFVAMIMLSALSLMAVWAFNSSTMNMRVVGNSQTRQEVFAAAQTAIEQTISTPVFVQQPQAVAAAPIDIDVDGDGNADHSARLVPAPNCYRTRTVPMGELDAAVPADLPCLRSASAMQNGIDADDNASGESLCADSEWNVRALVSDVASGATVAMVQGVAVRGLVTDAVNGCP